MFSRNADPRDNDFDCNDHGCPDGCECSECMPDGCMDEQTPEDLQVVAVAVQRGDLVIGGGDLQSVFAAVMRARAFSTTIGASS